MKSSTAKALAGGRKITKVITWDAIGQPDNTLELLRSAMILSTETGRYHEDGDTAEQGYRLSEALDTDLVLEIHTVAGLVWKSSTAAVPFEQAVTVETMEEEV